MGKENPEEDGGLKSDASQIHINPPPRKGSVSPAARGDQLNLMVNVGGLGGVDDGSGMSFYVERPDANDAGTDSQHRPPSRGSSLRRGPSAAQLQNLAPPATDFSNLDPSAFPTGPPNPPATLTSSSMSSLARHATLKRISGPDNGLTPPRRTSAQSDDLAPPPRKSSLSLTAPLDMTTTTTTHLKWPPVVSEHGLPRSAATTTTNILTTAAPQNPFHPKSAFPYASPFSTRPASSSAKSTSTHNSHSSSHASSASIIDLTSPFPINDEPRDEFGGFRFGIVFPVWEEPLHGHGGDGGVEEDSFAFSDVSEEDGWDDEDGEGTGGGLPLERRATNSTYGGERRGYGRRGSRRKHQSEPHAGGAGRGGGGAGHHFRSRSITLTPDHLLANFAAPPPPPPGFRRSTSSRSNPRSPTTTGAPQDSQADGRKLLATLPPSTRLSIRRARDGTVTLWLLDDSAGGSGGSHQYGQDGGGVEWRGPLAAAISAEMDAMRRSGSGRSGGGGGRRSGRGGGGGGVASSSSPTSQMWDVSNSLGREFSFRRDFMTHAHTPSDMSRVSTPMTIAWVEGRGTSLPRSRSPFMAAADGGGIGQGLLFSSFQFPGSG
ncbi:hypothetical protein HK104_002913, partial [Borealophlyctis nickersoniae]